MIQLCNNDTCTGCSACYNKCPRHAISMTENTEGFLNPIIDYNLCVNCNLCTSVCPQLNSVNLSYPQKTFIGWINDGNIRRDSASGGAFSVLALYVLRKGGIVFGAKMDDDLVVRHCFIDNESYLYTLRDSKYVQSNMSDVLRTAKRFLEEGREVLFTGTSCQIGGLVKYLGKDYDNLITVDLLCHGVPSPKVFKDYIRWLEEYKGFSKITRIKFRDKAISNESPNCLIEGMGHKGEKITIIESRIYNKWIQAFLGNNIIRPACYNCKYVSPNRVSDYTIADWFGWDSRKYWEGREAQKGVSAIFCNTAKACSIIPSLNMVLHEVRVEHGIKNKNEFFHKCLRPTSREQFWTDYSSLSFNEVVVKYFQTSLLPLYIIYNSIHKHSIYTKLIVLFLRYLHKVKLKLKNR